jgi:hypothetical protein
MLRESEIFVQKHAEYAVLRENNLRSVELALTRHLLNASHSKELVNGLSTRHNSRNSAQRLAAIARRARPPKWRLLIHKVWFY